MESANKRARARSAPSVLVVAILGIVAGGCLPDNPDESTTLVSSAATTGLCGYFPFPSGHVGPSLPPCIGACSSSGNGGTCTDPGDSPRFMVGYGCAVKTNGLPCDGGSNGGVQIGMWNSGETVSITSFQGWCTVQLDIISIGADGMVTLYDYLIWEPDQCSPQEPVNNPPVCSAGDPEVCAAAGQCTANVSVDAGSYDPDGDPITVSQAPPGPYGLGTTPVTLSVSDDQGATATCNGSVTVNDCEPPAITCYHTVAECTGDLSALVDPIDATAVDTCSAVTVNEYGEAVYPLGTTPLDYTATDAYGNSASCQGTVTVEDTQPPVVIVGEVPPLRPPNGDYVEIDIAQCIESATDVCEGDVSPSAEIGCVTSDEPDDVPNPNRVNDIVIVDGQHVRLRRERLGGGNGRVYVISFEVTDGSGNTTPATCRVIVPHDHADDDAVEDPPVQEVCL